MFKKQNIDSNNEKFQLKESENQSDVELEQNEEPFNESGYTIVEVNETDEQFENEQSLEYNYTPYHAHSFILDNTFPKLNEMLHMFDKLRGVLLNTLSLPDDIDQTLNKEFGHFIKEEQYKFNSGQMTFNEYFDNFYEIFKYATDKEVTGGNMNNIQVAKIKHSFVDYAQSIISPSKISNSLSERISERYAKKVSRMSEQLRTDLKNGEGKMSIEMFTEDLESSLDMFKLVTFQHLDHDTISFKDYLNKLKKIQ